MNELRTTLDMGRETYVALKCKQNDDRTLILTLLSNGVTWIPEVDSVLELRGKRSDSTVTIQTTTGITIANNVVTIDLSKDFTRVQGTVELELNIRKLTEITTFTFTLVIEPSVIQDGAMVSKNTSSLLEELNDVLGWGNMHLNNAINNVVNLTKKHGQYSVGLTNVTRVVLPTVEEGEYVSINYMFYADSNLSLIFEDENIKFSNQPIIQVGRSYRFTFEYVDGTWYCEWVKLERYLKDYIYKAGDTCDALTGGYSYGKTSPYDIGASNDGIKITMEYGSGDTNATTIKSIDLTDYAKLYVDLEYVATNSTNIYGEIFVGSTMVWKILFGAGYSRRIIEIDISAIVDSKTIMFFGDGVNRGRGRFNIYNAWLEKNEFVDTSQEIFTTSEKNKLSLISANANKVIDSTTNGNILIDNVEANVYTHPTGTNTHATTKTDIGLSNVDNTSDTNKPISTATQTALNLKVDTSQKGVANGVAQLDDNGIIPSSQLPSYVDDVLEYTSNSSFPTTGESGKIYLNTTNNLTYRWTGSGYAEISPSIALGETSSTAYAGDKGKTTTDKVNGHIANTNNPHNVTKAQLGLTNVPNVTTNNQTPTYSIAGSNTALTSGEILSTAFGKIAKAISSLISHLADAVSHITSTERTNWNSASTNNHVHNNKSVLDNTTASYTTAEKTKLRDITIDESGNVTVVDNSHNHIIGNIDGLQTALDGKVDDNQVLTNVPAGAIFTDTVYVHPTNHAPSIITQDSSNRFVTDVEKATWNGKATQATIDASINTIQIGGRNLIVLSKLASYLPYNTAPTITNGVISTVGAGTNHILTISVQGWIPENRQYTLSGIMKKNDTPVTNAMWEYKLASTEGGTTQYFYVDDITGKFVITQTYSGNKTFILHARITFEAGDVITLENFKMEKGNKATDRSPAPEDVDSAIALKADKITSGTTATRPIPTYIGQTHFDTDLGKPIWCKTVSPKVWVDGIGTVV